MPQKQEKGIKQENRKLKRRVKVTAKDVVMESM